MKSCFLLLLFIPYFATLSFSQSTSTDDENRLREFLFIKAFVGIKSVRSVDKAGCAFVEPLSADESTILCFDKNQRVTGWAIYDSKTKNITYNKFILVNKDSSEYIGKLERIDITVGESVDQNGIAKKERISNDGTAYLCFDKDNFIVGWTKSNQYGLFDFYEIILRIKE